MLSSFFLKLTSALKLVVGQAKSRPMHMHIGESTASGAERQYGKPSLYLDLPVVALFPLFFFLYDLGAYPLRDTNEGLYAEIAREMLETRNFIVPHLLGVPYIEKPPLLYWLMALSFHLFGPSAISARLASALPMAGLALALFVFCRGLGRPRAGFHAAIVLSTALPVVALSRTVLFDPLLTALLGGSLLAFLQWYLVRRKTWIRLAAVLLALATLEKGGVAPILAAGVIGTFLLLIRDFRALRSAADPVAIALFFAVAAPWHLLAAMQQERFAWFYFVNEHLLRFLGSREPHDYHLGPPYYYLPLVLLLLLPWTPFLWLLLRPSGEHDPVKKVLVRFCQAWVLFPLLFFSLSQSKGTYYILALAPAGALWLGMELASRSAAGGDRTLSRCLAISIAVCAAALWALLHTQRIPQSFEIGALALTLAALGCAAAWRPGSRLFLIPRETSWLTDAKLASVGVAAVPLLIAVLHAADAKSLRASSRHVAEMINRHGGAQPLVFVYRDFEDVFSSLPFYLGRPIKVIDSESRDLQFGCRIGEQSDTACISYQEFKNYIERFPVAVAVHQKRADAFRGLLGPGAWRIESSGDKRVFFNY